MNIFLRTFNNKINSKTGNPLPDGKYRGTPEWIKFNGLLLECLGLLGHEVFAQPEHPLTKDCESHGMNTFIPDKRIYCHLTKREKPQGDLFWMQMHMRELFTIDKNGWGVDHSCYGEFEPGIVDPEKARIFCEEKSYNLRKSGISKCEQSEEISWTPDEFILVPLQIPRDYTIRNHSPIGIPEFIKSIVSWAARNKQHIGFKMHPFNTGDTDLHNLVHDGLSYSPYIHKVEGNIHELIRKASGLFVINSGTGFEAIIHGKPVCTFGDADYSQVGFRAKVTELDSAAEYLRESDPKHTSIAYKYVYWYYKHFAYDITELGIKERLMRYLKETL